MLRAHLRQLSAILTLFMAATACTSAAPSPTAAPPKPAPTAAQAAAKPAATAAVAQPAAKPTEKPGANREALLKPMIEAAQKEGEVAVQFEGSVKQEVVNALAAAFNQRYGLNVRIKADMASGMVQKAVQAITEEKTGVAPSYDMMYVNGAYTGRLIAAGAFQAVENWAALLPDGAVPEKVSPGPIAGKAFMWSDTYFGMVYNTKLLGKADVPQTLKDVGNPKYKNSATIRSNGGTVIETAVLAYPPEQVLSILRSWGQNGLRILDTGDGGTVPVGLGELAVALNASEQQFEEAKASGNPVARAYFKDHVPQDAKYYGIRNRASHPNAAKLFALWLSGPEAFRFWKQLDYLNSNYADQSPATAAILKAVKDEGATVRSWFQSKETADKLTWLTATNDGEAFLKNVASALKGE